MRADKSSAAAVLIPQLKRRVQSLRRYAWDMRQLLQELRQNQYGVMPKQAANLCMTVESNCDSMVQIVEAYMLQCEGVESFYERHQEKVVASTLYMLTIVTVIILPVQLMTGIFGMNFQGKNPDDPLHSGKCAPGGLLSPCLPLPLCSCRSPHRRLK